MMRIVPEFRHLTLLGLAPCLLLAACDEEAKEPMQEPTTCDAGSDCGVEPPLTCDSGSEAADCGVEAPPTCDAGSDDADCGTPVISTPVTKVDVLIVVDDSGSMLAE